MVSSAVQKLLCLIRSHLFIFAFISFMRCIQTNIDEIYVKECSAYFSTRNFILSVFTFRCLIHFELVCLFVYFCLTCSIWKFPVQGLNQSCCCCLCQSCSNTRSLTHFTTAGTPLSLFLHMVIENVLISFFLHIYTCPVFPAPIIEETVFSPSHIFSAFAVD